MNEQNKADEGGTPVVLPTSLIQSPYFAAASLLFDCDFILAMDASAQVAAFSKHLSLQSDPNASARYEKIYQASLPKYIYPDGQIITMDEERRYNTKMPDGTIAKYPITGVMQLEGACGSGMQALSDRMYSDLDNPNIIGAMMPTNSGGGNGMAGALINQTVIDFAALKPIVSNENIAGSACAMGTMNCTKRFLNNSMSRQGSIGAYIPLDRILREYVSTYVKYVYAADSTEKNEGIREWFEHGTTEILQKDVDKFAAQFMADVKKARKTQIKNAGLRSNSTELNRMLKGGMFGAADLVKVGLADGQMGTRDTLKEIRTLAKSKNYSFNTGAAASEPDNNDTKMAELTEFTTLADAQAGYNAEVTKYETVKTLNAEIGAERTAAIAERDQLKTDLEAANTAKAAADAELETAKADKLAAEQALTTAQEATTAAETAKVTAEQALATATASNETLTADLATANAELETANSTIADLQPKADELATLQGVLAGATKLNDKGEEVPMTATDLVDFYNASKETGEEEGKKKDKKKVHTQTAASGFMGMMGVSEATAKSIK